MPSKAFPLIPCSEREKKLIDTKGKQKATTNVRLCRHATSEPYRLRRAGVVHILLPGGSQEALVSLVSMAKGRCPQDQPGPQSEAGHRAGADHGLGQPPSPARLVSPGPRTAHHRSLRRGGQIALRPVVIQ